MLYMTRDSITLGMPGKNHSKLSSNASGVSRCHHHHLSMWELTFRDLGVLAATCAHDGWRAKFQFQQPYNLSSSPPSRLADPQIGPTDSLGA